jgi:protein ImuB
MKIPSYDDLAPSIPDVDPTDVFSSVTRLLPAAGPVGIGREHPAPPQTGEVYAALHGPQIAALLAIAGDFSPRIERHGETDVVLDVSGLGRLLGDAHAIGAELARAGAERVAVCQSQIGARLLARARAGVSVAQPEDGDDALATALGPIPLGVLEQLTADTDQGSLFDVLRRWGLTTLGEFAALPAMALSSRIGQGGLAFQRMARGIDPRPLIPDPAVVRFVQSMELEWPIDALEPLSFVLARLLDPLSAALEAADRGAAAIRLDLRLTDRHTHSRLLQLPVAMRDARVLRTLLLLDLESHPPSAAIDIVTIEADPAPARIVQYSLLERALPSAETLATLNARLGALVGADRCGSPALLDSYRPDAFVMNMFGVFAPAPSLLNALGAPPPSALARGLGFASLPSGRSLGPQALPQFLPPSRGALRRDLAEACRSEHARHAEAGSSPAPQLRRFRPPVAVRVTIEHGRPVYLAIDRRGMPGGKVTRAAGPWRTSGAWWEGQPWNHDEWDVTVTDGSGCRLFRDRESRVWFLEGVFD